MPKGVSKSPVLSPLETTEHGYWSLDTNAVCILDGFTLACGMGSTWNWFIGTTKARFS